MEIVTENYINNYSMCNGNKIFAYKENDKIYTLVCVHHRASEYGFACINSTHELIQHICFSINSIKQAMTYHNVYVLNDITELQILINNQNLA